MTNKELVLNMLAALSTKEISESNDPKNFSDHVKNAVDGASIAKNARIELEQKTGKKGEAQEVSTKNKTQELVLIEGK